LQRYFSPAILTRGNHPNYLALNDGYEDEAPSEDWISNLIVNPTAQHPEELGPLPLPHTSDLSMVTVDTNSCLNSLDEVLPSESASQLPPLATGS
jgi:hypothetical protein